MILNLVKLVETYNLKIKGVLHIGAHFGQENSTYNQLKIENKIFFEPVRKSYIKLCENVGIKYCRNVALGNFSGEIDMFIEDANQGQSSSILKPSLHLIQYPHIKFNNSERVKISTLDSEIFDRVLFNFINIDVQGYEKEVFLGAKETLKYIDYIMTEVNRAEVYENVARVEDIDLFLMDFGFRRMLTDWAGGTWGDALYVKSY